MKTRSSLARTSCPNTLAGRLRTICTTSLSLLLLLTLPAVVQGQFTFTTNNGAITITEYTGSDSVVIIPSTINGLPVTSIGYEAFYNRTSLASVTIPDSVTSIGGFAFCSCSLTSVYFQGNAPSADWTVFEFDDNLTAYYLPETTGWGSTLGGARTVPIYTYTASSGVITVTKCNAPAAAVTIADMIFGLPVVSIGDGAFFGCTSLASVTIPNSVTNIGSTAFASCSALTSVTLPNSLARIGSYAFIYCSRLPSVTIPSSVTAIEDWTFSYCPSLAEVYFQGNAPGAGSDSSVFNSAPATIYYLPGTTGWSSTFDGRPTALWLLPNPMILNNSSSFGVRTNKFGFIVSWATNVPVVVEACTNLSNRVWQPVSTNPLTGGTAYFSDPQWTNYPGRFYRLRSP